MDREEYLAIEIDRLNRRITFLEVASLRGQVKQAVIDMYRDEREFLIEQWEKEQENG